VEWVALGKRHSVKVTSILRDKRQRHPNGKDVECHKSLLALDHFYYAGWDQLIGEHSFTFPPNVRSDAATSFWGRGHHSFVVLPDIREDCIFARKARQELR
jgi:hypothetical protein